MARYVRIEGSTVREIIDFDPSDRFHPSLEWVEVPDGVDVREGYIYDGSSNTFSQPPATESASVVVQQDVLDTASRRVLLEVLIAYINELRDKVGLIQITSQDFRERIKAIMNSIGMV